jgi:hypothetical protein
MVVATAAEPAVIENVALHAECGGALGKVEKPLEVVVEVDRLPDVECDGAVGGRMRGTGAQVVMEAVCHAVQPLAIAAIEPRRRVRLAPGELHLPRQQQLAAADDLLAGEDALSVVRVVTAPAGVHGPHLTPGEPEARHPDVQHGGRVWTGASLPPFPEMGAHGEVSSLWSPLLAPAAREVENFAADLRNGQGEDAVVHLVHLVGGVREARLNPE